MGRQSPSRWQALDKKVRKRSCSVYLEKPPNTTISQASYNPRNTLTSDSGEIKNWLTIQFESLSSTGGLVHPQTGLSTVLRG